MESTGTPRVQLLSNGSYHLMVTEQGLVFSHCKNWAVTRWGEEAAEGGLGNFCYLRDMSSGAFWSRWRHPLEIADPHRAPADERADDSLVHLHRSGSGARRDVSKGCEAAAHPVKTFTIPMHDVDRAIADGEDVGFVKIHVREGSDKILGATIVARHAVEMINSISLAMVAGISLRALANLVQAYYPTQGSAIRQAADAYLRTRLSPRIFRLACRWLHR